MNNIVKYSLYSWINLDQTQLLLKEKNLNL